MNSLTTLVAILLTILAFAMIAGLLKCLSDRRKRGAVVFDAGSNPAGRRQLGVGAVCLFLGLGGALGLTREFEFFSLSLAACGFFGVLAALMNWNGRLCICEHGVWLYSDLIAWRRITGHRWDHDDPASLTLQVRRLRGGQADTVDLPPIKLAEKNRPRFEELLNELLSTD
ncbi:MAG: hypothetical protein ACPGVU_23540 [Limisphaerales bacterium]